MRCIGQYLAAGIVTAVGGMLVSDLAGTFFNGMDYGSACVLGMCMYLCVVLVTCTGVLAAKLNNHAHPEGSSQKQSE